MDSIKSVLVTGGAGYIGSHTVLELLNSGYDIIAIDNFANSVSEGNAIGLQRVQQLTGKRVTFKNIDLCNLDQLVDLFNEYIIDGVVHLAAFKSVAESCEKPLEYYSNNLIGTINLLQVCKKMGVKNFIFSSSCTVYGSPKILPLTEEHQTGRTLTNPYGKTKHMVEQMLQDLYLADSLWNIIILRYFNPVGAHSSGQIGEDPKGVPSNLMPCVSQVAIGKLPHLNIYGTNFDTPDGSCVRDFIHIVDLAKGHSAALKKMATMNGGCKSYNLGMGKGYSVLEIIAAFEKTSGCTIKKIFTGPRAGDIASTYCSPTLAAKELGWKTEFGLEEICRDIWKWQLHNPDGYHTTQARLYRKA